MITFEVGQDQFNYRAAGIVLDEGWALLHRAEIDDFWVLPGGRVEMMESAEDALKREMMEELGIHVSVQRLVWIVENFFEYDSRSYHEIAFYFLMTLPHGSHLYEKDKLFTGDEHGVPGYEDGLKLFFQWYRLEELDDIVLYPLFLREKLTSIPESIEHIVHTD